MLLTQTTATATDTAAADRTNQWVRLIPPGVTDPDARIANSIGGLLSDVISSIFHSARTELRAIDLLCYSGHAHQEYLLRASTAPDVTPDVALPAVVTEEFETVHTGVSDPSALTGRFGMLIAKHLIDRLGVEIVQVDPTPLGRTPTLTTRLLTSATSPLTIDRDSPHSCLATYLDALIERSVPHVARTILAPAGPDSYHVEQQVGQFGPMARSLSRADLARHVRKETGPSLAAHYDTDAVTSTWEQLTETGWKLHTPSQQSPCQPTLCRQATNDAVAPTLYELCTRNTEYQRLLGTLGDPTPLATQYDSLSYTPTLEVEGDSLSAMLGLVWGYDTPYWKTQQGFDRRPPILRPLALIRSAPGTDQTAGHSPRVPTGSASSTGFWAPGQATIDDWPQAQYPVSQTPATQTDLRQRAIKRLREYGDSIETPGETFADAPWVSAVRTTPSDESSAVVIDGDGAIPPGELVAAASHGRPDHTITVVTETRDGAKRAAAILREPFVEANGTETVLYPRDARYWITRGYVAALPRTESFQWTIDSAGNVRLYVDGDAAAGGTVRDDSLAPIRSAADTTAPIRWIDPGSPPTVYESDGTVCDHYSSQTAVADQYQSIPLPTVPARRWWTSRATCIVMAADGPYVYDPLRVIRSWRDEDETALETFLDTYTCAVDQTLEATTIGTAFHRYLYPNNSTVTPGPHDVANTLADLPRRITGPTQFDSALRKPESMTLTRRGWIYPEVTAGRPAVPLAASTIAETPAASLAQSLAVDTTY